MCFRVFSMILFADSVVATSICLIKVRTCLLIYYYHHDIVKPLLHGIKNIAATLELTSEL